VWTLFLQHRAAFNWPVGAIPAHKLKQRGSTGERIFDKCGASTSTTLLVGRHSCFGSLALCAILTRQHISNCLGLL
jgi:hypothetical protein